MASIDKRPNGRWRARWREYPGGPQTTKHFPRKVDAERHLVDVQHRLLSGTYTAPAASKVTLEAYSAMWLQRMQPTWRPSTTRRIVVNLEQHILPILGPRPIGSIKRADVEALCSSAPLAPSTVRILRAHLSQLLGAAVDDGVIAHNPASRARLPKVELSRAQPVPLATVALISDALPAWLRIAVPLGVGVGLRQGELSGLTVDRLDMLRRTLRVDQQLVGAALAPTKTTSSDRTVPLAAFVVESLAEHLATHPAGIGGFVVTTPAGQPVTTAVFGRHWRRAVTDAQSPGLRFHHLRHTFASTLLSRGVSVKAVADWLGHTNPTITLTTYAHLMPADEEVARRVLHEALAPGAEDLLRTGTP